MQRKSMFIGVLIGVVLTLFVIAGFGCESCQRTMKSVSSSATGLKRKVVWTGFNGEKKTWTGQFKIDSNEGSPTVYFIDDGKTVVLGPGYYSVEVE